MAGLGDGEKLVTERSEDYSSTESIKAVPNEQQGMLGEPWAVWYYLKVKYERWGQLQRASLAE